MKKIKIVKVTPHNFKGFDEAYVDFTERTEIAGDNSTGKTSIADAVAFAFTGTNCFGEKVDFFKNDSDFAWVEVIFEDSEGEEKTLKREIQLDAKGSVSTTIRLDHTIMKTSSMPIESPLFLSSINPRYFFNLSATKGKDFVCSLETLDTEDVLEKIEDEDIVNLLKLLPKVTSDLKKVIKEKSSVDKEIKELEEKAELIKEKMKEESVFLNSYLYDSKDTLTDEELSKITDLKELKDAVVENYRIAMHQFAKKKLDQLSAELKDEVEPLEELQKKSNALKAYQDAYLDSATERLNSKMKNVRINLKGYTLAGKEKNVWEVFYKDIPIQNCSASEIILAGLEVNKMIKASGLDYPLFIDNAESLTKLPKEADEINQIVSFVVAKDYALSVFKEDVIVDIATMETMPRKNKEEVTVFRLLGTLFDCEE